MKQYRPLLIPLLSLVILTLGGSLLTTFLALKLHSLGESNFMVGSLTTAYYAGVVIGAFKLESVILRVGHIRAYSAFASLLAVVTILHGFYIDIYFWIPLRLIGGFATAGLYIVIESWILTGTDAKNRGTTLAFYMISVYIAQAGGQWLLNVASINTMIPYCIAGILATLSVIPLSLTRTVTPTFTEPETLNIRQMFNTSPSGVAACFVSGMVLGSIYGLYPTFIQNLGYSVSQISTVMGVTILGGMLFQYPIGKLSDHMSRRLVIAIVALLSALLSFVVMSFGEHNFLLVALFSFLLGGFTFCLYPIGISHACDRVNNNQIVSATQGLLLAYGIGATLGPIIAPLFNLFITNNGVLVYIMAMTIPLSAFLLWRKKNIASVPTEDKQDFAFVSDLTPITNEMDPRVEETAQ